MAEQAPSVAEYIDANGNTWQLDEATAKRLGYAKVSDKVLTADAETKPATRKVNTK